MEKKLIKDDFEMAMWMGSLVHCESEDMYSALNIIKNMSNEEIHAFVENYKK